jgi:molybdopterin synthase sulfur carrier subunit
LLWGYLMRDTVSTVVCVRLVYLARLREAFASAGETLELSGDDAPTVETVVDALRRRGDPWACELASGRAVRFAVNHRLARASQAVSDGDEVAIFPPVTGG